MNAVLTLAGLTLKEAVRRRVFVAGLLIALLFVTLAFLPIPYRGSPTGEDLLAAQDLRSKTLAWVGCGILKFFGSILAVTLAAGAITAEVEKGVLAVVAPKPLSRASIYIGKWLGFMTLLLGSMAIWSGLLAFAIWKQTQHFHPRMFGGALAACLFPLLFTTLTLAFSSFATYALSASLALIAAGMALAEDTFLLFHRIFGGQILITISKLCSDIVPLSRMNHWITRGLGDAGFDWSAFGPRAPGEAAVATTSGDMVYIFCYIAAFFVLGLVVFQKRDL